MCKLVRVSLENVSKDHRRMELAEDRDYFRALALDFNLMAVVTDFFVFEAMFQYLMKNTGL